MESQLKLRLESHEVLIKYYMMQSVKIEMNDYKPELIRSRVIPTKLDNQ